MSYHTGILPVRWTLQEIENLEYFYEEFNDPEISQYWQEVWGYRFRTGLQADFRTAQPAWIQHTVQDLRDQGFNLQNIGTSFYVMRPGDILPRHQDTYARYCRHHGVRTDQIWRAIVFLQDWQPGFLFEINDQSISGYDNGNYVIWYNDAPHMAGNVGSQPRYTLQITGTIHDGI